jgi:hypothetical protein
MALLKALALYRAKQQYARRLTPALHQLYGRRRYYKPDEIKSAATREKLNIDYICWGYALHLSPKDFAAVHAETGEQCDYISMHSEMIALREAAIGDGSHFSDHGGVDAGGGGGGGGGGDGD